jgi:hypothetical protein
LDIAYLFIIANITITTMMIATQQPGGMSSDLLAGRGTGGGLGEPERETGGVHG